MLIYCMQRLKKYLIIFVILIVVFSCKKYGHGYIKGTVYESGSNNPLSNVKITFGKWKKHPISGPYEYEILDSTFTDSNGEYIFYIHKKIDYRYSIYCHYNGYYPGVNSYEANNKRSTHDFSLDPLGYIKLHLKKSTQSYGLFSGSINNFSFNSFYKPNPFDTILTTVYKARGNAINYIDWSIIDTQDIQPTVTMPERQIYIGKGDTVLVVFQIN